VEGRAAVLLEDRLGGPERDVREPVGRDARRGGHARTDARVALVENQAEIEVSDRRPARREVDARQHRDEIDARGEVLAGHGLDADGRGLAHLQTAAIRLVEPRLEMDRRQVGQLENARAGPRAVALAELDAAAERPSRARILEDVDGAVGLRTICSVAALVRSTSKAALSRFRILPTSSASAPSFDDTSFA